MAAALAAGGTAEAADANLKELAVSRPQVMRTQYQGGSSGQAKPVTEAFMREKCDELADRAGLPKDLQDMKLVYPGLNLTFAEFLCGAFTLGTPVKIEADADDPPDGEVVRIQIKNFNIDFHRGRLLANGQTFVGVSSPSSGGIPALNFSKMSNIETGEIDQDSSNLVILDESWEPQMEAYLRQQLQQ